MTTTYTFQTSFAQQRLWFLDRLLGSSELYNIPWATQLSGPLDISALQHSFSALIERHESLRTAFTEQQGKPLQVISESLNFQCTVVDLTDLAQDQQATESLRILKTEANKAFDLKQTPLLRVALIKLASQEHILLITLHHIISDGGSITVFLQELTTFYSAFSQGKKADLPELLIQYADYAVWQREWLQGEVLDKQLNYWKTQLADAAVLDLPTDHARPKQLSFQGAREPISLPKELSQNLNLLSQSHGTTLFMTLLAALQVLLHRYSGQDDIVIGSPIAGRNRQEVEGLIGLFVNSLALRADLSGVPSFNELLRRVRKVCLEAYTHQDLPFEMLIAELQTERDMSRHPLFQVMLVLQPTENRIQLPGLSANRITLPNATAKFDLSLSLTESSSGLTGSIEYSTDLFEQATICRLIGHFQTLLESIVAEPQRSIAELSILTHLEQHQLSVDKQQSTLGQHAPICYPLTSSQKEIWFDQMLHKNIPLYNIGGYCSFPGPIDPILFEQAANLLITKHQVLSTLLLNERGEDQLPLQTYSQSLSIKVPVHDFSHQDNPHKVALDWMQQRFIEPFDLSETPLFRYELIKVNAEHYYWLLQYHHIIVDGYATALINRSLAEIYTQLTKNLVPDLEGPSYIDYINNDLSYVGSETFTKQRQFWLKKYSTPPEPLFSPQHRSRYTHKLIGSGCEKLYFSREFYARLQSMAKQHKVSLFHLLLSALYIYFTRTAQRDDFAIGLPILNRANANFKNTVGLFTSISPAQFNFGRNLTVAELLQQINKTLKTNYRYQRFPTSEISRTLGIKRERTQLFDIILSYENHDHDVHFADIHGQLTPLLHHYEQTPLMIFVRDFCIQNDVELDFVFNLAYFNSNEIQSLQARLVIILEALLKDSTTPIHALPVMTPQEHQQLKVWNDKQTDYPTDTCIHQLFEEQVAKTPNAIALVFESQQLSYQALNSRANKLAQYLIHYKGSDDQLLLTGNMLVAIAVERSLDMLISILAVLKAGCAYVPIDPSNPASRIAHILEDSKAPLLLTQSHLDLKLPSVQSTHLIYLDSLNLSATISDNIAVSISPEDIAYIIYTSGSTGKPKGCVITHANIARLFSATENLFHFGSDDVWSLFHSYAFDFSVWELWGALIYGGKLIIVPFWTSRSPDDFYTLLVQQKVTVLNQTPATFQQLIQIDSLRNEPLALRYVIFGGDALDCRMLEPWFARHGDTQPQLINMYGITETTVHVSYYPLSKKDTDNSANIIGKPLSDLHAYILDQQQQLVPIGTPGELCIAGAGLARAYLNQPELSAKKFVEVNLSGTKQRMYKSGDLARWLPDGNLDYLGRIDHQVKLRGFRIELGEIEAVIGRYQHIVDVLVLLYDDPINDKRLIAYLTHETNNAPDLNALRQHLKERLPEYMLPAAFVLLDQFPLTANGKVDRKALPIPDKTNLQSTEEYVAPTTPVETSLVDTWQEILNIESIGIHDDFFALGGHSLLAMQVISRLRDNLSIDLPLKTFFESPTIAQLSKKLATDHSQKIQLPSVTPFAYTNEIPLSFAQQRLWFLDQLEAKKDTHNMSIPLLLKGSLQIDVLKKGLAEIISRHSCLRTTFQLHNNQSFQFVSPPFPIKLTRHNLLDSKGSKQKEEIQRLASQESQYHFSLEQGPLIRFNLLLLEKKSHLLLITMHHIISDGWSINILIHELSILYAAFANGNPSPLPVLAIQYTDYALWQRQTLSGDVLASLLKYWKQHLKDAPTLLELPTDRPRPSVQTYHGASKRILLPQALSQGLKALSQESGVTLYITLLSTFKLLLSRFSGQTDIVVGTPIAGRNRSELEDLVGLFINTQALRTDLSGNPSFIELLNRVRVVAFNAIEHQELPFEKLVEEIQPVRSLSHTPLFQVWFNMLNLPDIEYEPSDLTIENISIGQTVSAQYDLTLYVREQDNAIQLSLVYNIDLFDAPRMEEMLNQYNALLTQIVANPKQGIANYSLLTPQAKLLLPDPQQELINSGTETVVLKFSNIAKIASERLAITDKNSTWTYTQLEAKSNQLANYLVENGVESQHVVAIYAYRGASLIWAILGVLKAGAAFLILDPTYPAIRLLEYLRITKPQGFLALEQVEKVPELLTEFLHHSSTVILQRSNCSIDTCEQQFSAYSSQSCPVNIAVDNIAYITFTSGSTGIPKAVVTTHQPLAHFLDWYYQEFDFSTLDRFSMLSGLSHDIMLRDIFTPLCLGATLCIPEQSFLEEPSEVIAWLLQEKISVTQLTPAFGQLLGVAIKNTHQKPINSLRYVFFGGDILTTNDIKSIYNLAQSSTCVNFYGTTETPQAVSFFIIPKSPREQEYHQKQRINLPIGQGIDSAQLLVLNTNQQLAGIGEEGEIYVRTPFLAKGYLADEQLTEKRFIANPLSQIVMDRVYKTGDLARYLPNGNVQFYGRIDHQIKLRGYRIELSEIEIALEQYAGINKVIVICIGEGVDEKRQVAYFTHENHITPVLSELRFFLKQSLPSYMIPSAFIVLEKFPLTPNGKIDLNALPAPDNSSLSAEHSYTAPSSPLEEHLVIIWQDVLKINRVGIDDNFFELGGHSLLIVVLCTQIASNLKIKVPVSIIFQFPSVRLLSNYLAEKEHPQETKMHVAITPIKFTGNRPPLFWLHGGAVIPLIHKNIDDNQPFYFLNHQSLDGKKAKYQTIDEIVRYYINAIIQVDPTGPYFLGGYSAGGIIIFEIARELRKQGKQVALLFLLDPVGLNNNRVGRQTDSESNEYALLKKLGYVTYVVHKTRPVKKRLLYKLQSAAINTRLSLGIKLPTELIWPYLSRLYRHAYRHYQPNPITQGVNKAVLIQLKNNNSLLWSNNFKGQAETHFINTTHLKLIEPDQAVQWMKFLVQALQDSAPKQPD